MANGLLNLQTDLKSLRYGSDKPYVTKDVNNPPTSNQTGMQINKRVDDVSRIAQMLIDRPGLKYLFNEALLNQATTDRSIAKARKDGKSVAGAVLGQVKSTAQVVGSTLAQIPVNGTGTHFLKGFRTDTYIRPTNQGDTTAFAEFFGAGGVEGAPYALQGEKVPTPPESIESNFETGNLKQLRPDFKEYSNTSSYAQNTVPVGSADTISIPHTTVVDVKEKPIKLSEVKPDSGNIGNDGKQNYTATSTYTGTDTKSNISAIQSGTFIKTTDKVNADQRQKVEKSKAISEPGNGKVVDANNVNRSVKDFRTGPTSFNYSSPVINKETRVNLGNQGKNIGKVSYSHIDQDKVDQLNKQDISDTRIDGTKAARDLAKFYFEIITPDETKFLHFRAHITGLDDSYSGDWDSHQYVGRAEEFFTYKGFKRDISVGFTIAAQSRAEMKPLYRKMVYLASATAPTYGGGSNFMRGTLARLTVGSYFSQIPGIITSVKYTWQTDYQWEIAMQNPEGGIDDDQQELPMALDCSISFKPIHDFAPQTGLKHFFTSPNPLNGSKPFF